MNTNIIIENIRTFSGRNIIPIKPLTILVGENSSGKSTFLSVVSNISNRNTFPFSTNFNEPPFDLGSYDTIATYKGGKYGRSKSFSIGFQTEGEKTRHKETLATFQNDIGLPRLSRYFIKHVKGEIEFSFYKENKETLTDIRVKLENYSEDRKGISLSSYGDLANLPLLLYRTYRSTKTEEFAKHFLQYQAIFDKNYFRTSLAIAPIRTKPRRTYDQVIDRFNPEGSHIPNKLAKFFLDESFQDEKKQLLEELEAFGKQSGLFNGLDVKTFGKELNNPFQISAKIFRRFVNLLDVGYGVSQSLPVLVECILAKNQLLLLQQPEVHLHPKAQAALGSFFARLVKRGSNHLLIESHSDFIIDRIRNEVANGNLSNESVLILFFDRNGFETKVHPITLDGKGNILNAPANYREFFLEEELSLLSR